jgi:Iron-dependent Transcriptional regulator
MLRSGAIQSLRALLVMADAPGRWCSVAELARVQELPQARLEQLLLRLRRAGVLVARRGRSGGYRLARPAAELSLAGILVALESGLPGAALPWATGSGGSLAAIVAGEGLLHAASSGTQIDTPHTDPGGRVVAADRDPLRQEQPVKPAPGPLPPGADPPLPDDASARVTSALNRRLQRALERELARTSLEDLHHDLRSARALFSEDGGMVLG